MRKYIFLLSFVLISLSLYLIFNFNIFLSFLVGLTTTSFVLFATFKSYKNFVTNAVENKLDTAFLDKDEIDKIEDPFDLYDDEEQKQEPTKENLKEVIKEEKKKFSVLKNGKYLFKTLPAQFSALRVLSYVFLVFGFIFLQENSYLSIFAYLIGITAGIIIVSIFNFMKQKEIQHE